jgi:murein DD-endopeptidase MepM/ murein hydrolase activator NlpD
LIPENLQPEGKKKRLIKKMRAKYKLVIMDAETFEEKISLRLSRLNVFIVTGTLGILLVFFTTYIIAFTPLREYIPGYSDVGLSKSVYKLGLRADSLEKMISQRDAYLLSIRNVLTNNFISEQNSDSIKPKTDYSRISNTRSQEDSALRNDIENRDKYSMYYSGAIGTPKQNIMGINFFPPIKGFPSSHFNASEKHYGVDIVAGENEAVKACLSGTVLMAGWNLEFGYVITIQHTANLVSIYKHNSALLKKQGDFVKSGEPIGIIGSSGAQTSGPHLHFELWYNGLPLNPEQYIQF